MTSIFPPFNRRTSFRKQPYFFEAGRGVNSKGLAGPIPALSLTFTSGVLDPRITFSRPSLATYFDSTGKLTYAPNNIALQSNAFSSATWSKINAGTGTAPVLTSGQIDPDGGTTAWRLQANSGGGTGPTDYSVMRQALATSNIGIRSIWIKSNTGVNQVVYFGTPTVGALVTATPTWTRVSFKPTVSSVIFDIGSYPNVPGGGTASVDVLIWQAQCEEVTYQTTPSTYVATTASAYYGPRFEYDPVTLVPRGLLIEEAMAANLALYSQDFRDTATVGSSRPWVWSNLTAALTTATSSPDGTQNAYKLAESTTSSVAHSVAQSISVTSGAAYTFTVFAKMAERSFVALQPFGGAVFAYFNLSTGVVGTTGGSPTATSIQPVGNGWYRCSITANAPFSGPVNVFVYPAATDGNATYAGAIGSGVYLWGAQYEARAFATSYIPTAASTAARSADVVSMTGTNFSSWFSATQGTFVVQADIIAANAAKSATLVGAPTSSYLPLYLTAAAAPLGRTWDGTNIATTANPASTGGAFKITNTYRSDGLAVCLNAGTVASNSYNGAFSSMTSVYFGSGNTGTDLFLNGHIASIQYYGVRLSNTQLQRLTA